MGKEYERISLITVSFHAAHFNMYYSIQIIWLHLDASK